MPPSQSPSLGRRAFLAGSGLVLGCDSSFPAVTIEEANVRIDGRFVGAGYGAPNPAGTDAMARAGAGQRLFWNTMSSRPVAVAALPPAFRGLAR